MRTLAIVNPRSGGADDLSRVASTIRHHPALREPDIRITGERFDACLLARAGAERGFRRVVAVGGDGTVNEVVHGLMQTDEETRRQVMLAVIPLGTGNDLARALGLPLDLEETLDRFGELTPRWTDVVRVETEREKRSCVNVSAGGFSGEVDERVTPERKRSWGPLAYLRGALELLPDPEAYRIELTVDDGQPRILEVLNVVVANGRTVAGGIPIAPTSRLDDGLLDVVAVRHAPMSALAGFAPRCLVGKHLDHDLTVHGRGRSVSVRSTPGMTFNVDGEPIGGTPATWQVEPHALQILAAEGAPGFQAPEES